MAVPGVLVAGDMGELAEDAVADGELESEHAVAAEPDGCQMHGVGQQVGDGGAVGGEVEESSETGIAVAGADGVEDRFAVHDVTDG